MNINTIKNSNLSNYFKFNSDFPDSVFRIALDSFVFTTFEDLFSESFYSALQKSKFDILNFFIIEPSFSEKVVRNIEFDLKNDTAEEYINVLKREIEDKEFFEIPFDLYSILEKCSIYTNTKDLFIYGEREWDILILGFSDPLKKEVFLNYFDRSLSYDDFLGVISQSFGGEINDIPSDVKTKIEKNYK